MRTQPRSTLFPWQKPNQGVCQQGIRTATITALKTLQNCCHPFVLQLPALLETQAALLLTW